VRKALSFVNKNAPKVDSSRLSVTVKPEQTYKFQRQRQSEMTIRTVFFDVGNTLLTPKIPEGQVMVDAAASLGISVDLELVSQNVPRMWQHYEELYDADNSVWADEDRAVNIWLTIYAYLCNIVGIFDKAPQIAQLGYEKYLEPESWTLFDDALPTLDALKARGIRMGLISNWDSSLKSVIKGLGLDSYFDLIISSAEVRLHKPQPEIFEFALYETGANASEAMHVGDHRVADVIGSSRVGITPVLIDRDNRHPEFEGFIKVQDLRDILKHLD
jgi:putative hydrolase of the HAD superfamily